MKKNKNVTPFIKLNLVGKRILLRPYKISDFKECMISHNMRLDPRNQFDRPIPISTEINKDKFKDRVLIYKNRGKNRITYIFGIFDKKSGKHIGQINLFTINQELSWGNLGYHIQNQFAGKGYATEASKLALKMAFKFLNFHRIEAAIELENKISKKVALKIGLKHEGRRTNFFPSGISVDVYALSALDYK